MMMGSFSSITVWRRLVLLLVVWSLSTDLAAVEAAVGMAEYGRLVDILNNHHPEETVTTGSDGDDVQERVLTQRLDHFSPTHGRTFQQRYFYSSRYVHSDATSSVQYAFLCVGGEGPSLTSRVLVDSVHCSGDMLELASRLHTGQQASVHLYALEHRYYGRSYPEFQNDKNETISPVTNENLVFLSSRQALGDLAHFVEQMTTTLQQQQQHTQNLRATTSTPIKWVTFGGSYPGMLAGWARLKYPHLIHAAVSNSAPIQAQLDMASYNDRVAFDLQYDRIGGSQECLQIFQEGHAQIVEYLKQAREQKNATLQQNIADAFHLCDASVLNDLSNVQTWIGDGVVKVGAQSNDPSCEKSDNNDGGDPMCDIGKLCSVALQEKAKPNKKAWQVLAKMAEIQHLYNDCLDVDWQGTLDYFADPQKGLAGGLRSWLWQTCVEFGFYQTCEIGSSCPFAMGYHPIEEDFQICKYAFGIDPEEVKESIEQTIEYYGGRQLTGGSRILSVNGEVDPWATLARVNSTEDHGGLLPTYQVKGASHHFWTHPIKDTDDEEVQKARQVIYDTIFRWLQLSSEAKDTKITTSTA